MKRICNPIMTLVISAILTFSYASPPTLLDPEESRDKQEEARAFLLTISQELIAEEQEREALKQQLAKQNNAKKAKKTKQDTPRLERHDKTCLCFQKTATKIAIDQINGGKLSQDTCPRHRIKYQNVKAVKAMMRQKLQDSPSADTMIESTPLFR